VIELLRRISPEDEGWISGGPEMKIPATHNPVVAYETG
jgi:hypothetical protein